VAGGALLVKEAGGRLSDFQGANDFLFGKSIISSNSHIFGAFQQTIRRRMESDEMDLK
jgi:myo-inositol-1(or 4)-monophosphatase